MTLQQNIRTVLDRNFTETKDEIKDHATERLTKLIENNCGDGVWVTTVLIPGSSNMQLRFFSNEQAAIDYCEYYKEHGANYSKYAVDSSFSMGE